MYGYINFEISRDWNMSIEKQPLPETVDRKEFTDVICKLIAAPPLPKAAIERKRPVKTASPNQAQTKQPKP